MTANDLPSEVKASAGPDSFFTVHLGSSVREVVDELICRTVTYAGGNKVRAAKILGVGRRTIYSRRQPLRRRDDPMSLVVADRRRFQTRLTRHLPDRKNIRHGGLTLNLSLTCNIDSRRVKARSE